MIDKKIKERLFKNPDVVSVGYGFKYTGGVKTNARCIVVGVKEKKPKGLVVKARRVPSAVEGQITDVQEKDIKAFSLTAKMRPCPPGYSIGHTAITAGTLGTYVKTETTGDDWVILSNNHVLAASNAGKINDKVIQPGKADGGFSGSDHFAWLREFVTINWDNGNGAGCNLFARAWMKLKGIKAIEQPKPNLVDAALALPVNQSYVNRVYPISKVMVGEFTNFELGDEVIKEGRTTEFTSGTVDAVDVMVRVDYGGPVATFDDQIEIRSPNGKEFSAGGDSGSAIRDKNGTKIGGLLFAGSGGSDPVTIANRIGNVIEYLKIRI